MGQVGTEGFDFHGVRPDVRPTVVAVRKDTNKARGANFQEASDRAHFYTWAPKNGTLHSASNYQPWVQNRVLGKWLDDLWTDGKLSNEVYDDLARKVRTGYSNRKRDLELVRAAEKDKRSESSETP